MLEATQLKSDKAKLVVALGSSLLYHVTERFQKNSLNFSGQKSGCHVKDLCELLPPFSCLKSSATQPDHIHLLLHLPTMMIKSCLTSLSSQDQTDQKEGMAFSQSSNYGSEPGTHDHPRHISARNRIVGTQPLEDSGQWGVAVDARPPAVAGSPWETQGLSCRAQKGGPPLQAGVVLASLLFQIRLPRHNAGLTLVCPGGVMGTATC